MIRIRVRIRVRVRVRVMVRIIVRIRVSAKITAGGGGCCLVSPDWFGLKRRRLHYASTQCASTGQRHTGVR